MDATIERQFTRLTPDGIRTSVARGLAVETPVAVEVNGLGFAVMMATPTDLEDFAHGFVRAERLADDAADVIEVEAHPAERGVILRVTLRPERTERVTQRVRHRTSDSACGLCGIENLEAALRPLPSVTAKSGAGDEALFRALASLSDHQPLNAATGAAHAAALCAADGTIRLVREDVGRHNAFDKLIGAMARAGLGWDGGFALLSARCSYELVEKAALAGCPLLVTVSAPTSLAVERAREAGLALAVLARGDAILLA